MYGQRGGKGWTRGGAKIFDDPIIINSHYHEMVQSFVSKILGGREHIFSWKKKSNST